jgi:ribose 5-phosphate isomerase B
MIALGCDHAGYELKQAVMRYLKEHKLEFFDYGTYSTESADYPVYARKVAEAILSGACQRGILICGTGIGISIAANRIKGIRAAVCTDVFTAKQTRLHNDANILAMGGRVVTEGVALEIVSAFLSTAYSNEEPHIHRVALLDKTEEAIL